ncbi:hypothetical protein NDU88_006336 [Pleurodeles waltl]|uniref:Uncharacterized protein n=1 Tax=Pleurodeles waltl TaxID=8319 RepID=A0AAV7SP76_PLEWA|nr:hypothetical protein NDU88_006336 [Pleurodeles waltl]
MGASAPPDSGSSNPGLGSACSRWEAACGRGHRAGAASVAAVRDRPGQPGPCLETSRYPVRPERGPVGGRARSRECLQSLGGSAGPGAAPRPGPPCGRGHQAGTASVPAGWGRPGPPGPRLETSRHPVRPERGLAGGRAWSRRRRRQADPDLTGSGANQSPVDRWTRHREPEYLYSAGGGATL